MACKLDSTVCDNRKASGNKTVEELSAEQQQSLNEEKRSVHKNTIWDEKSGDESASRVPAEQLQCQNEIKQWIENEAKFFGRTDDDFLQMFLRSCDYDKELAKKTLTHYYESRRDIPVWWANRNVFDENVFTLMQSKIIRAVIERDDRSPTVVITSISRYTKFSFDDLLKYGSICLECTVRRRNSQKNGFIWIIDCKDYRWWIIWQIINPIFAKKFIKSYYLGMPLKLNSLILLNEPAITFTGIKLFQPFAPRHLQSIVQCVGSDLTELGELVPMAIMPEEYGGHAGPLEQHDEAFVSELLAFNDYLLDDNKYGFQSI